MRALRTLLPVLLLLPLLAAGCGGDDDPDPLPPADHSSTDSSDDPTGDSSNGTDGKAGGDDQQPPPPPKAIKLANNEKAAYDTARKDYNRWADIAAKLNAKGEATKKAYQAVAEHTFLPAGKQFWESLQRYDKANVRILGGKETKIRWEVPIKVDLDARMNGGPAPLVVWKRCTVRGDDLRVMHGDKEIPQPAKNKRSVSRIEVRADANGYWRATKAGTVSHRC